MFQGGDRIKKTYVGGTEVVKAYKGDKPSIWPVSEVTEIIFIKNGANPSLTVEFDHHGTNTTTTKPHFYYRIGYSRGTGTVHFDSEDWIDVTGNSITFIPTTSGNEFYTLQLCGKGNTTIGRSTNDYTTIKVIGNDLFTQATHICLDKLLDYDNPPTVLPDYCFYKLLYLDVQQLDCLWGIRTYATTAGNYTFGDFIKKLDSEGITIDMLNMANRQQTTFNNWITNTNVIDGRIYCQSSLYLEPNSDSGVPNGWTRIDT